MIVNRVLDSVVRHLALKPIQRRDAIAFAYLTQFVLNRLSTMGATPEKSRRPACGIRNP